MAERSVPQVARVEDYDSDESFVKPGTRREARRRQPTSSGPPKAIDRYRDRRLRDGASDSGYSSFSGGSQGKTPYYPDEVTLQGRETDNAPGVLPPSKTTTTDPSKKPKPVIHRSSSPRSKDKPPESRPLSCEDPNCQHAACYNSRSPQYQQAPIYATQYSYQYAQAPTTPASQYGSGLGFQPAPRSRNASSRLARPASFHGYSVPSQYAGVGANQGPPPSASAYAKTYYANSIPPQPAGVNANTGLPPPASAYQSNYYAAWVQAYQRQQLLQQQLQQQGAYQQSPSYGAPPNSPLVFSSPNDSATYPLRNDLPAYDAAIQSRPSVGLHRTYSARPSPREPTMPGAYLRDQVEESSEDSSESLESDYSDENYEIQRRNRARDSRVTSSSSGRRPFWYHPTAPVVPARSTRDVLRRNLETETGLEYISSSDHVDADRTARVVVNSTRRRSRQDYSPIRRRPSISTMASSARTKATTVSSGSSRVTKATTVSSGDGPANVIIEGFNGRRVTYLSPEDRDGRGHPQIQTDDIKLRDEVRAYQDAMRGATPPAELTADNIREHNRRASSRQVPARNRQDGSSPLPSAESTEIRIGDNIIHVDSGSTVELRQGENGESVLVIGTASGKEKTYRTGTATRNSGHLEQDAARFDSNKTLDARIGGPSKLQAGNGSEVHVESGVSEGTEVGAKPVDAMSVGSNVDIYEASSSALKGQKASSTQPPTASTLNKGLGSEEDFKELIVTLKPFLKQTKLRDQAEQVRQMTSNDTQRGTRITGSVSGDDEEIEGSDIGNHVYDAGSIKTDHHEIDMLKENKTKLSRYLVAELFSGIQAVRSTGRSISRESVSGLHELLRHFCLLVERRVVIKAGLEVWVAEFICHHRNAIAASVLSNFSAASEREPLEKSDMVDPSYVDRMDLLWRGDRTGTAGDTEEIPVDQDPGSVHDLEKGSDGAEDSSFPSYFQAAVDSLFAGEEYQWLLNQLHIASRTMITGDTFMKVRDALTESRGDHSQVVFEASWNPLTFVQQQYGGIESFDLGSVVCIAGQAELAQATTCKDYIDVMWPNTGSSTLTKLNNLIKQELDLIRGAELGDKTSCINQMTISNDHLIVKAYGSCVELLELGEMLAWLGAACRASESDCISYCAPRVSCYSSTSYSIDYDLSEVDEKDIGLGGSSKCWLKIFNNPTIVSGYPIRLREHGEPGLEVPIRMAAVLGYAQFATSFNDHFLLKGPCSALLPTMQKGTTIIWHYIVNDDQEPMTYEQALGRQSDCPKIDLLCLEGSRHFVGWTANAQILTGTKRAEYDNINYGGPFIEKPGYALSEVVVGGGYKYFNIGGTFTPGKKDYHHFQGISGPYPLQISQAGRYNVVLYDVTDRRGWLLDGTSFVLHLARAALSHPLGHFAEDSAERLVEQFIHLDELPSPVRRATAKEVLLNRTNRQIPIFQDAEPGESSKDSDKAAMWRFEDLVIYYCNILDKIRGHQIKLQQSHQWKVQNPLSTPKTLEGFGFLDILQMEPDLRPRAVKLTSSASHWLKVTERAGAINILGSNFGDLLRPSQQMCQYQGQVPCGVDFLAAPVELLKQIAMKRCGISRGSLQLADGIVWTKPSASFANTGCICSNNQKPLGRKADSKPRGCIVHVTEIGSSKPALHQSEARREMGLEIDYSAGAIILGRKCDLSKSRPPLHCSAQTVYLGAESSPDADKFSQDSGIDVNSVGGSSTS